MRGSWCSDLHGRRHFITRISSADDATPRCSDNNCVIDDGGGSEETVMMMRSIEVVAEKAETESGDDA